MVPDQRRPRLRRPVLGFRRRLPPRRRQDGRVLHRNLFPLAALLHDASLFQLQDENLCWVHIVGGGLQFRVSSNSGTYVQVSCIMAGLGAYPTSSKPRPGQGPTITPVKWTEGEEVIGSQESNWSLDNKTV